MAVIPHRGASAFWVWDTGLLSWVKGQQPILNAGSVTITGALTDAELRAADVKVTLDSEVVPVTGTFWQGTQPISAAALPLPAGASTSAQQDTLLTELQLKADLTETQPVSLASVPSHAVTNAGAFAVQAAAQPGVDVGDVTINNAAGGAAVNIQDGGNTITVDGAVTTSGTVTEENSAAILTALTVGPVPISGSVSASTAADVVSVEANAGYTAGDLAETLTQTPDGRLRTLVSGVVNDAVQAYIDGEIRSVSLTNDGRMRVATANESYNLASWGTPERLEIIASHVNDSHPLCGW